MWCTQVDTEHPFSKQSVLLPTTDMHPRDRLVLRLQIAGGLINQLHLLASLTGSCKRAETRAECLIVVEIRPNTNIVNIPILLERANYTLFKAYFKEYFIRKEEINFRCNLIAQTDEQNIFVRSYNLDSPKSQATSSKESAPYIMMVLEPSWQMGFTVNTLCAVQAVVEITSKAVRTTCMLSLVMHRTHRSIACSFNSEVEEGKVSVRRI